MRSCRLCVGACTGARKTTHTRGARSRKIWHPSCTPLRHIAGVGSRNAGETGMRRVLLAACVLALGAGGALAQAYPSRPVTMIVPFGAGGPTDALARIVAERMRSPLGQAVLVENVTGASGTIGLARVARAAADGYTMVLGNWPSFVVASATYANLPYDVAKDFEPIAQRPNNPSIEVGT